MESENVENGKLPDSPKSKLPIYGPYGESHIQPFVKPCNFYPINKVAEFTSEVDIDYLITSIKEYGQLNPILLWYNKKTRRKELVDGRHRMWACNILGIKVITSELPKETKEKDLPALILDIQLTQQKVPNKNASSAIITRYLDLYGNRTNNSMKAMRLKYPHVMLTEKDMTAMKYLLTKEPLWFAQLELGHGVAPEGTYTKLTSPRALHQLSKERYASLKDGGRVTETTSSDPKLAKLFKQVHTLIDSIEIVETIDGANLAYVLSKISKELQVKYPDIEVEDIATHYTGEIYGELA